MSSISQLHANLKRALTPTSKQHAAKHSNRGLFGDLFGAVVKTGAQVGVNEAVGKWTPEHRVNKAHIT